MKINYQNVMEETVQELRRNGLRPSLLLQSCCGPCSSYVLECLTADFDVTLYYYNPNIYPETEYDKRLSVQDQLLAQMKPQVKRLTAPYDPERFYVAVRGLEAEPEGGARCPVCFALRLEQTAREAARLGFDYFTTTLTVSPHKNAELLNTLGTEIGAKYGIAYLCSDFKKKEGYKRSIELSRQYELYRQNYCGCEFSLKSSQTAEKAL